MPPCPFMGALYHARGGNTRHDAFVWGLARGADRAGVELHQKTAVTGIETDAGRVTAVQTNRGRVEADVFISATAGWSTLTLGVAGVRLPITTHILPAVLNQPPQPVPPRVHVSGPIDLPLTSTR